MLPPIVMGLTNFLMVPGNLDAEVWDGEVPRFDTAGNPINPDSAIAGPSIFPVVTLNMTEGGMRRTWTTLDAYDDRGEILIQVYGTSRLSVEGTMGTIEELLAQASNWLKSQINMGGPTTNPFYIIQILLDTWTCIRETEVRLAGSQLCYRGDMHYDCHVHGAVSTS